jgi:hypothetical protein
MQLRCPNCGIVHKTEDYPGAFEVNCVCGYSILVPDEKAFAVPIETPSAKVPTALEEEDSALAVTPETPEAEPIVAENMTAPDELPQGMPYDPFELKEATGEIASAPIEMPAFESPPETPASTDEAADIPADRPMGITQRAPEEAPQSQMTGQALVERSLSASLGQLLGPSYKIQIQGLSREKVVMLSKRCEELARARPWVTLELEKRGLRFEDWPEQPEMNNVPEILAVEIYLGCFELGGSCTFEKLP